jgi:hypothetical protein
MFLENFSTHGLNMLRLPIFFVIFKMLSFRCWKFSPKFITVLQKIKLLPRRTECLAVLSAVLKDSFETARFTMENLNIHAGNVTPTYLKIIPELFLVLFIITMMSILVTATVTRHAAMERKTYILMTLSPAAAASWLCRI